MAHLSPGTPPRGVPVGARADTSAAIGHSSHPGSLVQEGKPAPTFTLPDEGGADVSLEEFHGKPVVLSFHPEDDTRANQNSSGL